MKSAQKCKENINIIKKITYFKEKTVEMEH